jgi:hypothetical protein
MLEHGVAKLQNTNWPQLMQECCCYDHFLVLHLLDARHADGKSYNNKCLAECAKVTVLQQQPDAAGKCPQPSAAGTNKVSEEAGCRCPRNLVPVCGSGMWLSLAVTANSTELASSHEAVHESRNGSAFLLSWYMQPIHRQVLSRQQSLSVVCCSCRWQKLQQQMPGRVRQGHSGAAEARCQWQVPTGGIWHHQCRQQAREQAPGLHMSLRQDVQACLWDRWVVIDARYCVCL